jgi:hypothetical protein
MQWLTLTSQDEGNWGVLGGTCAIIFALATLILFILALVSILQAGNLTGGGKAIWIVVILIFPILGSLAWFLFGRNARLSK